jgi:hypothetical protein
MTKAACTAASGIAAGANDPLAEVILRHPTRFGRNFVIATGRVNDPGVLAFPVAQLRIDNVLWRSTGPNSRSPPSPSWTRRRSPRRRA